VLRASRPATDCCSTGCRHRSRSWVVIDSVTNRSPQTPNVGESTDERAAPMDQVEQTPLEPAAPAAEVDDFEHLYLTVRRTLAEAQSRSSTDAEQRLWRARSTRVKRLRETLNPDDSTQVLEAIAMLHAEQQTATAGIVTQLAAADPRSHQ